MGGRGQSGQAIKLFQARLVKLVLPSICDTSLSSSMMWNLQSYPTTVLNERMWHFYVGGGLKHTLTLLHIFRSQDPRPSGSTPLSLAQNHTPTSSGKDWDRIIWYIDDIKNHGRITTVIIRYTPSCWIEQLTLYNRRIIEICISVIVTVTIKEERSNEHERFSYQSRCQLLYL